MEQLKKSKEFEDLCLCLKAKGIHRTKEEYFRLMMNITKEHFKQHN